MIQGVLYSVAMISTWIFTFITLVIVLISKKANPVISSFSDILNPLHGAFNFLIYLVPVFRKMLKTRKLQKRQLENEMSEKNITVNSTVASSIHTLIRPKDNSKVIRFEEEKEEEKREIVSLPPVFDLEISENGRDEETRIYETQNNKDNMTDDDNDYY